MKTRIGRLPESLSEAVALLRGGEVVGLPTETVYGLGAHALDLVACAKIFEAKERPLSDPLIVHVPDTTVAAELAVFDPLARSLAARYWPGPLTMVLPRRATVPDIVTSGQETVALRVSAHPVFREVSAAFGGPIAAPSANRFGRISPTSAAHVLEELGGRIPLILDGGACAHGIESTIVLVRDGQLRILRRGPVTEEELSTFARVKSGTADVVAPGGLLSHYAPRTPLVLVDRAEPAPPPETGLLAWESEKGSNYAAVERLSASRDLREAAANLYAAMRRLDGAGLRLIHAERLPAEGLGAAIMERLRKAAARD